ncbi:MAG: acyl-[acyl-carrier-protein] thioesterase [Christensenellales bacterium]
MDVFLEEKKRIVSYDVDVNSCWKPSAILNEMCEISERHSASMQASRTDLLERGYFWVLLRARIEMRRYPVLNDEISVRTWASHQGGRIFSRHYAFADRAKDIGYASTIWLVMNMETRQLARAPKDMAFLNYNSQEPAPMPPLKPIRTDLPMRTMEVRSPRFSDLDMNRHMNNTRYAEWICDTLGREQFEENMLSALQINFLKESDQSRRIRICMAQEADRFFIEGKDDTDQTPLYEAEGIWTPRKSLEQDKVF